MKRSMQLNLLSSCCSPHGLALKTPACQVLHSEGSGKTRFFWPKSSYVQVTTESCPPRSRFGARLKMHPRLHAPKKRPGRGCDITVFESRLLSSTPVAATPDTLQLSRVLPESEKNSLGVVGSQHGGL